MSGARAGKALSKPDPLSPRSAVGGRCRSLPLRRQGAEGVCGLDATVWRIWSSTAGAPLCPYGTSPPAARGERKGGRDDSFSTLLWRVDAGAGALGGGPELLADLVDQVDQFLALGCVVGLLGFAGDLGGVPHQLVD